MVSSSMDHMIALTIFIAATLLFIGLFSQTIQTAVIYQNNRATATKASDVLDSILINPGTPVTWGRSGANPVGFGLQDPEFTQYKLDGFSLMRLESHSASWITFSKAQNETGLYYSDHSEGSNSYLYIPSSYILNYSSAEKLLGLNGTYGFQLTFTPIITVTISNQSQNPLTFSIKADGTGFPLANAKVSYKLFLLELEGTNQFPSFAVINGTTKTNSQGVASATFSGISSSQSYVFIASVSLGGLNGVGYHVSSIQEDTHVTPLIGNLTESQILLAHSADIEGVASEDILTYNTTMVNFNSETFALQELQVNNTGILCAGLANPYGHLTLYNNPAVLIIAYNSSASQGGFSLMPWGISALSYTVTFGDTSSALDWVSTDIRQVTVNGVAYQVKISVWSYKGYQVNG